MSGVAKQVNATADTQQFLTFKLAGEEYGVGMRKDDKDLQTRLQKALDEMKKDGTSAQISQKWFGANVIK